MIVDAELIPETVWRFAMGRKIVIDCCCYFYTIIVTVIVPVFVPVFV